MQNAIHHKPGSDTDFPEDSRGLDRGVGLWHLKPVSHGFWKSVSDPDFAERFWKSVSDPGFGLTLHTIVPTVWIPIQ
jgi:hypothetical protein